jgi:hypothetical protein
LAGSSRWWQGGVRECGRGFVGRREDGERAGGLEGGDELAGDDGADQGGEAEADWASWTLSLLASAWARHTDTRVIDLSMMLLEVVDDMRGRLGGPRDVSMTCHDVSLSSPNIAAECDFPAVGICRRAA